MRKSKPPNVTCLTCGAQFRVKPSAAATTKYCSRHCTHIGRSGPQTQPVTRVCLHCQQPFTFRPISAKTRARKFCSVTCSNKHQTVAYNTPCKRCGTPVKSYAAYPRSYCSTACYNAHRAAVTVAKTCPRCGALFSVHKKIAHRYTVCSAECKGAELGDKACERCGDTFRTNLTRPQKYCSEQCYRPPVYQACDNCGTRYRVKPTQAGVRRFCCFACWRKHNGETTLEAAVRDALEKLAIPFEQERRCGRYSIDFALLLLGIALEVDGEYWHQNPKRDARRDAALRKSGWKVARITESEVLEARSLPKLLKAVITETIRV